MTDHDVIRQLEDIRKLALRDYPYSGADKLNDELLLTLGYIAGLAGKAIGDYQVVRGCRDGEN